MSPISWKIRARSPLVRSVASGEVGRVVGPVVLVDDRFVGSVPARGRLVHEAVDRRRMESTRRSRADRSGQAATTRSRPARLARYSARSASATSSAIGWSATRATATPTDTVTRRRRRAGRGRARPPPPGPARRRPVRPRARVAQQDDELLAAVACRHVVLAHGPDDGRADGSQHLVAVVVPVRVVERLELVDVDHQRRPRRRPPAGAGQEPAELVEVAAIRKPGQRVGGRPRLRRRAARCTRDSAADASIAAPPRSRRVAGDHHAPGVRCDRTIAPMAAPSTVSGAARVLVRP